MAKTTSSKDEAPISSHFNLWYSSDHSHSSRKPHLESHSGCQSASWALATFSKMVLLIQISKGKAHRKFRASELTRCLALGGLTISVKYVSEGGEMRWNASECWFQTTRVKFAIADKSMQAWDPKRQFSLALTEDPAFVTHSPELPFPSKNYRLWKTQLSL